MKSPRFALTATVGFLVTGCVPTLHPIYTPKEIVFEKALVGLWQKQEDYAGEKLTWQFTKAGDHSYRLVYRNKEGRGAFHAHLARIQGRTFLDLQPEIKEGSANRFYMGHLIQAHSFYLVEQIQPDLRMRAMDHNWLDKYLKKHPKAIAHERLDHCLVITASTQELQKFVLEHIGTEGAFGETCLLERDQ